MRSVRKALRIAGVTAFVLLLAVIPLSGAQAAVEWNSGTKTNVYDPAGNRYAYAPAVIREGDTEHMWTCHNAADGEIRDHIYYTRIVGGTVAESRSVLQAGPEGAWDSFHVCDPSVVAGKFRYGGTTYDYALFYLGNDVDASYHNQIGIAFSNDLSGDWVKYPQPIVEYPNDGYWGVGQPSATSIDGQGRVLLFFTRGDPSATAGYRIDMNLNDMSSPQIGSPIRLTTDGLTDSGGNPDWLNNFDIAYDPSRDRFIAVRELHPYPSGNPSYISESLQIVSIDGGSVWGGGGTWKVEGTLGPAMTGFPRNHNGGLLRTAYGTLPEPGSVEAYFTDSAAAPDLVGRAEFTYDIWRIKGALTDGDVVVEKPLSGFEGKRFSLSSMTVNINTNEIKLHGKVDPKIVKENEERNVWIGYRIYDLQGYLIEAGTAYRDRIDADGAFSIPVVKPQGEDGGRVRFEVYLLSAKGKTIESLERKVEWR